MKRFIFHRMLSFWLGLPGLVFLAWVWWTSMHENVQITRPFEVYSRGHRILRSLEGMMSSPGLLTFYASRIDPPSGLVVRKLAPEVYRRPLGRPASASWFPMPERFWREDGSDPGLGVRGCRVSLPVWMITGLYLLGWTLLLAWRVRARRKGMAAEVEQGMAVAGS